MAVMTTFDILKKGFVDVVTMRSPTASGVSV